MTTLALSGAQHADLLSHLFPGDGLEAAAVMLCSQIPGSRSLVARLVHPVAHADCARTVDRITWPGTVLAEAMGTAEDEGLAVVLVHSHPGGQLTFSSVDDDSDRVVLHAIAAGWSGKTPPVTCSAIMTSDGSIAVRRFDDGTWTNFDTVRIAGDDIRHLRVGEPCSTTVIAFGDGMRDEISRRTACVVGVSGTGSVVAEQLVRLGIGRLILIDFDEVEERNLNRILNSRPEHAAARLAKVTMFAQAAAAVRPELKVEPIDKTIVSRTAVLAAARADIVFSCVDSVEGRMVADLLCQAFCIPLIDMGVTITTRSLANGARTIADAWTRVDYVQPGGSTLLSRGVWTAKALRSEYLARVAPEAHHGEIAEGYIKGIHAEAPSVIALNMKAASAAVLEYIARSFPFRHEPNSAFARSMSSLGEMEGENFAEHSFDRDEAAALGVGAAAPLLGLPMLEIPC